MGDTTELFAAIGAFFIIVLFCASVVAINSDSWMKWCKAGERVVIGNQIYKCVKVEVK